MLLQMVSLAKPPVPPPSSSPLYQRLHATSIEFILSMNKDTSSPSLFNLPRLQAVRTTDFIQTWGHNYMVSQKSNYAKPMSIDILVGHLNEAIPMLESWDAEVSDVVVDVEMMRTVVRSSHWIQAKGKEEKVEDDIVWLLDMDEEGRRVRKAVEFKDEKAEERVGEVMGE